VFPDLKPHRFNLNDDTQKLADAALKKDEDLRKEVEKLKSKKKAKKNEREDDPKDSKPEKEQS
jgi:hypothetical protein